MPIKDLTAHIGIKDLIAASIKASMFCMCVIILMNCQSISRLLTLEELQLH